MPLSHAPRGATGPRRTLDGPRRCWRIAFADRRRPRPGDDRELGVVRRRPRRTCSVSLPTEAWMSLLEVGQFMHLARSVLASRRAPSGTAPGPGTSWSVAVRITGWGNGIDRSEQPGAPVGVELGERLIQQHDRASCRTPRRRHRPRPARKASSAARRPLGRTAAHAGRAHLWRNAMSSRCGPCAGCRTGGGIGMLLEHRPARHAMFSPAQLDADVARR